MWEIRKVPQGSWGHTGSQRPRCFSRDPTSWPGVGRGIDGARGALELPRGVEPGPL